MREADPLDTLLQTRRRILLAGWLVAAAGVLVRAGEVQIAEAPRWRAQAVEQHRTTSEVPAPRGAILDRDGTPLTLSQESYRVAVAPRELQDAEEATRLLVDALGISLREAGRATTAERPWVLLPGRFDPEVLQTLGGVRGVHLQRELNRSYPHGDLARGVLGAVVDGEARGGIERQFDDVLRGRPGREVAARDHVGRELPGSALQIAPPVPGGEVVLTLDLDLQEIGRQALGEAVATTGARGGDLVVVDPRTGEILALVSLMDGRTDGLSSLNAPYEPGSTLKPFTVAGILTHRVGALTDSVDAEGGSWMAPGRRRPLTDVGRHDVITLGEALRVSSNVGVAKAAQALSRGQQYSVLRDFGFGAQTGIHLPGEVSGLLRRPERWSELSPVSLAIGYEISVTPLQMAMAYAALANGGRLLEPRIVRETRDPSGQVLQRFEPRIVRQVVDPAVTREIGAVLVEAVEGGTGTAARMATFQVAGKSGTSRVALGGGYLAGRYYASFAGYFPADDPQLVVFVKLDSPRGRYYGGATAAPVTRATLEAVLAARRPPLDRGALVRSVRTPGPVGEGTGARFAAQLLTPPSGVPLPGLRASLPRAPLSGEPSGPTREVLLEPLAEVGVPGVAVPDVAGLPPRVAVRRLHGAGFRVRWDGAGTVAGTWPEAGERRLPGDTVVLRSGRAP